MTPAATPPADTRPARPALAREMGLAGLTATGVCSMVGAGINVIPFMIQRHVPGIGPHVLPAFLFAAVPAVLAGLCYAMLASAMPRAGGSYIYASRGVGPYVGFVASFSQWFALSVATGVVAYLLVPFLRDIAVAAGWPGVAGTLEQGPLRLAISLGMLWLAAAINLRGVRSYERTIVPLMWLTFALGGVVIAAGFAFSHADFAAALQTAMPGASVPATPEPPLSRSVLLTASALLFASFIGFDSIAQAGGEARRPSRDLPLAIGLAVGSVGLFYMLFTAAVYHAVPWQYVAAEARVRDLTAPGLLGLLLPPFWTVVIVAAAAVALAKDLPAMLLAISRLMFAWAEDGVFPARIAAVHPRHRTPHMAIMASAGMGSVGVLGCHLAGDFFLGVDILVTAMLVNFLAMALAVLVLPRRNPALACRISVVSWRPAQVAIALLSLALLGTFLAVHSWRDLTMPAVAWYARSTPVWALVMAAGSVIYMREMRALRARGADVDARFAALPPE